MQQFFLISIYNRKIKAWPHDRENYTKSSIWHEKTFVRENWYWYCGIVSVEAWKLYLKFI